MELELIRSELQLEQVRCGKHGRMTISQPQREAI